MENIKKRIWILLDRMHLHFLIEYYLVAKHYLINRKNNKEFCQNNKNFSVPPYSLAWEAYGHTDWQLYYYTGRSHAEFIAGIVKSHVKSNTAIILEWGCGPARIIRHLPDMMQYSKLDLYGADFNKKTIKWCEKNIKGVSFSKNKLAPPFEYAPSSFDCIYAFSVFTHLSEEMHFAWIEEIKRILKPNGILIFTTHGDNYLKKLTPGEKDSYKNGNLTVKQSPHEGKVFFSAFHPHAFVQNRLLKDFEISSIITNHAKSYTQQDVWVAKKKAATSEKTY